MNNIPTFEHFSIVKQLDDSNFESYILESLNEELDDEDIRIARAQKSSVGRKVGRVAAWIGVPYLMAFRELWKHYEKKKKVENLLKDTEDPARREKLRKELEDLKFRQVKIAQRIKDIREQGKGETDPKKAMTYQAEIDKLKDKMTNLN